MSQNVQPFVTTPSLRLLTGPPFNPWRSAQLPSILALWFRRARTRRQLARLDTAGLQDIGLCHAERDAECARWFWQGADR